MILHIFMTTVVPILLLVLIGYFMDKKFHMDLDTLSKINFYVVSPAFLFTNTYSYTVSAESAQVVWLTIIGFAATWIASMIFEKALGLSRENPVFFVMPCYLTTVVTLGCRLLCLSTPMSRFCKTVHLYGYRRLSPFR